MAIYGHLVRKGLIFSTITNNFTKSGSKARVVDLDFDLRVSSPKFNVHQKLLIVPCFKLSDFVSTSNLLFGWYDVINLITLIWNK